MDMCYRFSRGYGRTGLKRELCEIVCCVEAGQTDCKSRKPTGMKDDEASDIWGYEDCMNQVCGVLFRGKCNALCDAVWKI